MVTFIRATLLILLLLLLLIEKNNGRRISKQYPYKRSIMIAFDRLKDTLFMQPKAFIAGLYPSYQHDYIFGSINKIYRREILCEFDNTFFFTTWILDTLFESYELTMEDTDGLKLDITDAYIENIMKTLLHYFHDTSHGSSVPLIHYYTFNDTNIEHQMPPDFDDSGLALLLYSWLKQFQNEFPNSYSIISHINPLSLLPFYVKYAYQPFSEDIHKNMIDPRTYYWLRHFIDDYIKQQTAAKSDKNNLLFIPTWIINLDEFLLLKKTRLQQYGFPSDVDVIVNANCIRALVQTILTYPSSYFQWINKRFLKLLRDTTNLIKWSIESNWINKRTELVSPYYPSVNILYWSLSRTVYYLRNADLEYFYTNDRLVYDTFIYIHRTFMQIMREQMTSNVIKNIKRDNDWIYFDDELSSFDEVKYNEDRLFTTSMIVDTLINTWTKKMPKNKILFEYSKATPKAIIEIVKHASVFINDCITNKDYPKEQAFFTMGFGDKFGKISQYPYNYFRYLNGTRRTSTKSSLEGDYNDGLDSILGVSGIIDNEKYKTLLSEQVNQDGIPEYVTHWNSSGLIYFSSPAFTYSMGILALVKSQLLLKQYCDDNSHDSNYCLPHEQSHHSETTTMKKENTTFPKIADILSPFDLKCDKKFCYYKEHYFRYD